MHWPTSHPHIVSKITRDSCPIPGGRWKCVLLSILLDGTPSSMASSTWYIEPSLLSRLSIQVFRFCSTVGPSKKNTSRTPNLANWFTKNCAFSPYCFSWPPPIHSRSPYKWRMQEFPSTTITNSWSKGNWYQLLRQNKVYVKN